MSGGANLHSRWGMEWEWNRAWDGMGMESLSGWNGNGMARWSHWSGPVPPTRLSKVRCNRHSPAVAVGGDSTIARSGLCRARASSLARSSATPPEVALVERKKARSNKQQDGVLEEGRLVRRSKPLPSASSHRSHLRGDLGSSREPRALGHLRGAEPTPTRARCWIISPAARVECLQQHWFSGAYFVGVAVWRCKRTAERKRVSALGLWWAKVRRGFMPRGAGEHAFGAC